MFIDLFGNDTTASLFYTNDVKVLIDIVLRQLMDIAPGDKVIDLTINDFPHAIIDTLMWFYFQPFQRRQYLELCRRVLRTSGYNEHRHRADDVLKCFTRFVKCKIKIIFFYKKNIVKIVFIVLGYSAKKHRRVSRTRSWFEKLVTNFRICLRYDPLVNLPRFKMRKICRRWCESKLLSRDNCSTWLPFTIILCNSPKDFISIWSMFINYNNSEWITLLITYLLNRTVSSIKFDERGVISSLIFASTCKDECWRMIDEGDNQKLICVDNFTILLYL